MFINRIKVLNWSTQMVDRAMLHQLIDALPEERLQNVERVLQYEGITPSGVGRIPDEIADRVRQQLAMRQIERDDWDSLRTKMRQGISRSTERLRVNGMFDPARTMPDGSTSACHGVDKDGALLVLTFRTSRDTNLKSRSVCRFCKKVSHFDIAKMLQVLMVSTRIMRLISRSLRASDAYLLINPYTTPYLRLKIVSDNLRYQHLCKTDMPFAQHLGLLGDLYRSLPAFPFESEHCCVIALRVKREGELVHSLTLQT